MAENQIGLPRRRRELFPAVELGEAGKLAIPPLPSPIVELEKGAKRGRRHSGAGESRDLGKKRSRVAQPASWILVELGLGAITRDHFHRVSARVSDELRTLLQTSRINPEVSTELIFLHVFTRSTS
jgi:hypothetical protein